MVVEVMSDSVRDDVLSRLTSSKNQRLAFSVIWDMTAGSGKKSRCFLNDKFVEGGINSKNHNVAISRATRGLVEKGLIRKFEELMHRFDCSAYVYCLNEPGIHKFLGEK